METIVSTDSLKRAAAAAIRFVPLHASMPILKNFNLIGNGSLTIQATRLDQDISIGMLGTTDAHWSQTVPARSFADLINTLPDGAVKLQHDPKTMTLTLGCGDVHARFKGIGSEEFPIVENSAAGATIQGDLLHAAIQRVAFAASHDESHPALTGVLWRENGTTLTLAAADGFRMSLVTLPFVPFDDEQHTTIIPAQTLASLDRLGIENAAVTVEHGQGKMVFAAFDAVISSALIDGNYPDVERIIPAEFQTHVPINRGELLAAVKRAMIFARDMANIVVIDINDQTVTVSANSSDSGSSETTLAVEDTGAPVRIAFNGHYLIDALNAARTEDVLLSLNAENNPAVLRECDEASTWIHVMMPMHIGRA